MIGVIVAAALLATVPMLFGIYPLNVLTPSMSHLNEESSIKPEDLDGAMGHLLPGSLIYVRSTDMADIEKYDVVTVKIDGGYLTHRVIDFTTTEDGQPALRTQGDANSTPDGMLVTEKNIVGKVIFCIPYLGGIINSIKSPPGMYLGIAALCFLLLFVFMPDIVDFLLKKEEPQAAAPAAGSPEANNPEVETPEAEDPVAEAPENEAPETKTPETESSEADIPDTPDPDGSTNP